MKKLLSVALIATMLLSLFAFATYAEENYDTTLSIVAEEVVNGTDKYVKVSIVNGVELSSRFLNSTLYFTYDDEVLIPAEEADDYDEDYFAEEIDEDGTEYSELTKVTATVGNNKSGDMVVSLHSSSENGSKAAAGKAILNKWFKVKSDIEGTRYVAFRWIHKTEYTSFISGAEEVTTGTYAEKVYSNVNFVDGAIEIIGADLATDNIVLPGAYAYSSKNDFEGGKVDINGTEKTITTDYAAAFGTVVPRNGASRVKAGFLLSTESTGIKVDNTTIKNFEAANFASDNIFGGLFYGPGLKAGATYYVMPYVTYSDGVTLYAPSAVSFTMPN